MSYAINVSDRERRVIFNLPPPFSVLWCTNPIYTRAIELCFLCYMRSNERWLIDIESVLYEHFDAEYQAEDQDFLEAISYEVNNLLYQIHQHHLPYNAAIEAVMGYFNPELYDYLEIECSMYQPDIEIIIHAKDAFQ